MGGNLFVAAKPHISFGLSNVGSAYAEMTVSETCSIFRRIEVVFRYSDSTGEWTGRDSTGQIVASGENDVTLAELTGISFIGTAAEGDEIIIDPSRGAARGMTFVPKRGEKLAAAAARLTYADAGNNSTATMTASWWRACCEELDLDDISLNFGNNLASVHQQSFLKMTVGRIIPANIDKVDLASLKQQSTVDFSILVRRICSEAYRSASPIAIRTGISEQERSSEQ